MSERVEVHFQKLAFNVPEDKFYSGIFDPRTGALTLDHEYEKPPSNEFTQRLGAVSLALVVKRVSDVAPKYKTTLVNLDGGKALLKLGLSATGGMFKDRFYFTQGVELKQFDPVTQITTVLEQGVTEIAAGPEGVVKFTTDGKIVNNSAVPKLQLGSFTGLVADAGFVANHWVWYYLRRNEKSGGALWLLNIDTQDQHEVKKDLPQCRLVLSKLSVSGGKQR